MVGKVDSRDLGLNRSGIEKVGKGQERTGQVGRDRTALKGKGKQDKSERDFPDRNSPALYHQLDLALLSLIF
jgi:hypothetical protein